MVQRSQKSCRSGVPFSYAHGSRNFLPSATRKKELISAQPPLSPYPEGAYQSGRRQSRMWDELGAGGPPSGKELKDTCPCCTTVVLRVSGYYYTTYTIAASSGYRD